MHFKNTANFLASGHINFVNFGKTVFVTGPRIIIPIFVLHVHGIHVLLEISKFILQFL